MCVIGDGTQDPQIISGDKLNDYDYLVKNGHEQGNLRMTKKINESKKLLTDKLMSLEETGPTALGPALLTGIAMADEFCSEVTGPERARIVYGY